MIRPPMPSPTSGTIGGPALCARDTLLGGRVPRGDAQHAAAPRSPPGGGAAHTDESCCAESSSDGARCIRSPRQRPFGDAGAPTVAAAGGRVGVDVRRYADATPTIPPAPEEASLWRLPVLARRLPMPPCPPPRKGLRDSGAPGAPNASASSPPSCRLSAPGSAPLSAAGVELAERTAAGVYVTLMGFDVALTLMWSMHW
eukprot:56634-Chlamydomonas_euryale.AAC.1